MNLFEWECLLLVLFHADSSGFRPISKIMQLKWLTGTQLPLFQLFVAMCDSGTKRPAWELFYGYCKAKGISSIYSGKWAEQMRPDGGGGNYGPNSGGFDQLGFGTLMYYRE